MSSRIFQGVIVQMKDATTRCIGVVDEQGFVIACSELSMIGSRLDDFQAAVGEVQEQLFATDTRTYKILSASTARFEYAVFVEGNDQTARSICILAAVGMTEASTNFEESITKPLSSRTSFRTTFSPATCMCAPRSCILPPTCRALCCWCAR